MSYIPCGGKRGNMGGILILLTATGLVVCLRGSIICEFHVAAYISRLPAVNHHNGVLIMEIIVQCLTYVEAGGSQQEQQQQRHDRKKDQSGR